MENASSCLAGNNNNMNKLLLLLSGNYLP